MALTRLVFCRAAHNFSYASDTTRQAQIYNINASCKLVMLRFIFKGVRNMVLSCE